MLNAIVAHRKARINPFDSLTAAERDEYEAWILECHANTPDPQPQDFAYRIYPDKDVWEVPGYGRVWIDREGNWHHNGPTVGFFNLCRERFEDAVIDLIQAVHWQLDPKGVQS